MIVTSSPSRIQTIPSPITTRQWKLDHGSRSSRAGIRGLDRLEPARVGRRVSRFHAEHRHTRAANGENG